MSATPQPTPDPLWDFPEVPAGVLRSQEAYWRELPQLLPMKSRKRQWVAYHGDERVAFGASQAELDQECFRRGLKEDEIYVGRLEPQYAPPWEIEDLDAFGEGVVGEEGLSA